MEHQNDNGRKRWGQSRRLAFIDLRLQYDGQINRRDLISFFDISVPQASTDLANYQKLASNNLEYDASSRTYVALDAFQPVFGRSAATTYLDELHRLERGVIDRDESFVGYAPPTGVVSTPSRAIGASEVAVIVRAIRDRLALRVSYQSMDDPGPLDRVITPHALGFDGLRWHTRAWCHGRAIFRDFAIGRLIVKGAADGVEDINSQADVGWSTIVTVVLVPNPKLSPAQRKMVMRDYEMKNGRAKLECRKAMLFYTLRHLNLESGEVSDKPAQQHVIVHNREEVDRWVVEDRVGVST